MLCRSDAGADTGLQCSACSFSAASVGGDSVWSAGEEVSATVGSPGLLSPGAIRTLSDQAAQTGSLDRKLTSTMYVDDLEIWAQQFHFQMTFLENRGQDCPVVVLPGIERRAPLNLLDAPLHAVYPTPALMQYPVSMLAIQQAAAAGLQTTLRTPVQARGDFRDGFSAFLDLRSQAAGGASASGTIATPGLNIVVTTRTPGLRIFAAPQFWINLNTVFGSALSTPVAGPISPGAYVFGSQGPTTPKQFETAVYPIPPNVTVPMFA
jgi:hypothetical protein